MSSARRPLALLGASLLTVTSLAACAPAPKSAPAAPVGPVDRVMVFPLATPVKFSDTFGAGRSGGRSHEGQDLMAPKGTVAVAAASGKVTYLKHSSDGLSGNMLRITDADGWQYVYIHMNNDTPGTDDGANVYEQAFFDGIRQGQRVKAGEPIAYVGDSGNAESTGAHLHFELRRPDGSVVNAYNSLRAATVAPLDAATVAAAAPTGSLDGASAPAPGTVRIFGWAIDRAVAGPVDVSIYIDGSPRGTAVASVDRPDVGAAFPDKGAAHGYEIEMPSVAAGSHKVCAIAHNAGDGGGSTRLGCAIVTVG